MKQLGDRRQPDLDSVYLGHRLQPSWPHLLPAKLHEPVLPSRHE